MQLLKLSVINAIHPLTKVFILIVYNFQFVKPIYKKRKKKKTDVANYRPVSLITTFTKILEKVMYSRLSQHLNVNKILTLKQFGF